MSGYFARLAQRAKPPGPVLRNVALSPGHMTDSRSAAEGIGERNDASGIEETHLWISSPTAVTAQRSQPHPPTTGLGAAETESVNDNLHHSGQTTQAEQLPPTEPSVAGIETDLANDATMPEDDRALHAPVPAASTATRIEASWSPAPARPQPLAQSAPPKYAATSATETESGPSQETITAEHQIVMGEAEFGMPLNRISEVDAPHQAATDDRKEELPVTGPEPAYGKALERASVQSHAASQDRPSTQQQPEAAPGHAVVRELSERLEVRIGSISMQVYPAQSETSARPNHPLAAHRPANKPTAPLRLSRYYLRSC